MVDMDGGRPQTASQILVVDDDPQVLKYLRVRSYRIGLLRDQHHFGRRGHRLLKERRFDLLILDLSMPDTDGFEILQMVRTQMRDLKVLVISGFMQGTLLKAAELVGAQRNPR